MYSWISLCVLLINVEWCLGRYDLYMNATETEKLLGHKAEFYFVKNGKIKLNAVKYRMDLPTHASCLAFTWHALNLEDVLHFTIVHSVNSSSLVKMEYKADGKIPSEKQDVLRIKYDFCIYAKCIDQVEGVVVINVYLTVSGYSVPNKTTLHFTRTKSCGKGLMSPMKGMNKGSNSNEKRAFYITVIVACFVIFGTAIAVGILHVQSIPKPEKEREREPPRPPVRPPRCRPMPPYVTPINGPVNLIVPVLRHTYLPPDRLAPVGCPPVGCPPVGCPPVGCPPVGCPPVGCPPVGCPPVGYPPVGCPPVGYPPVGCPPVGYPPVGYPPVACAPVLVINREAFLPVPAETSTIGNQIPQDPLHPEDTVPLREKRNKEIQQKLQDIVLDRSRVSLGDVIQEGTFGKIYEGVVTGPEDGEVQDVLVKTVSDKASDEQASLLLAEGSMLKGLNHQNICSILYVCLSDDDLNRPLVLTPNMNQGNLKNFLKKSRTPEGTGLEKSVTTRDLIDIALQVANGMLYMEMRNLVHKDLATRNCMIDDEFHVKITDCALSRDLFPMDYHCLGDNENKPVKWMSVESLEQHRFTTASDVWSFGIELWELITLGQQPYGNIDAFEMVFYLKNGHRLGQPTGCPDDLFTIMGYCWALSEEERPGFAQLIILLTKFFNALIQFI